MKGAERGSLRLHNYLARSRPGLRAAGERPQDQQQHGSPNGVHRPAPALYPFGPAATNAGLGRKVDERWRGLAARGHQTPCRPHWASSW